MIRRKKINDDIELTPILDDDSSIETPEGKEDDLTELEDLVEESSEDKMMKKKKHFSFSLPWKKKQSADKEEEVHGDSVDDGEKGEKDLSLSKEDTSEERLKEESPEEAVASSVNSKDILGLSEDGVEYLAVEGEKKINKKKIAIVAALIVCAIGIGISFLVRNLDSGNDGKAYVESVSVLAGLGSANGGTNRYTGEVEAQESWKITLDSDMSVATCYVKVGDEVKKGDKLFAYNTEELKLNQEKKELEVDTMQNEINQLTKDIATYQSDLKSASSSEKIELQTQILTAQTTIKKDQYSIKSGKEEIEKIKKNITDATVKSKMDGVIKTINTALGEGSSDDSSGMDTSTEDSSVYMTVLSVGDYRVKGKISETNISSIEEGQSMIVRSRVDDQTWTGVIDSVKTDSTTDDESSSSTSSDYYDEGSSSETASSYYFYVELDSVDGLLMGQHVLLEVDNGQEEDRDGIWLSSAYILIEDENYYAWVDNNGKLEKRSIEVGEYDEVLDEYQIVSGLTAEDYIACDDIDLKAGMKTTTVDPYSEEDSDGEDVDSEEDGVDNGIYDEFEEDYDEESYDESGDDFEDDGAYTDSDDESSDIIYESE